MRQAERYLAELNAHRARLGLGPVTEKDLEAYGADRSADLAEMEAALARKAKK